jgi:hypothetical protein
VFSEVVVGFISYDVSTLVRVGKFHFYSVATNFKSLRVIISSFSTLSQFVAYKSIRLLYSSISSRSKDLNIINIATDKEVCVYLMVLNGLRKISKPNFSDFDF